MYGLELLKVKCYAMGHSKHFLRFLNMGQPRPLFVYFCPFLNTMTIIGSTKFDHKSTDGMLGIRTRDPWLVGADESTEL